MNTKTYRFHVSGMHCNACMLMIDSELSEHEKVRGAKSSLSKNEVVIDGDFGDMTDEAIAAELTALVSDRGYSLSVERTKKSVAWSDFKVALPIALAFLFVFVFLQKMGIVNLVSADQVTYGTAFFIGIIASLSTCMAVVGGLLLSMSATFAREGDGTKPQLLFHIGRLVSFFVLGGVIGAIGSAFTLGITSTFILNVVIALVMVVLGINLLDIFHWSKKLQPAIPKFISRHAIGVTKTNHTLTPLLVGVATFFLPCGFTQAMQLYTLSTGSFFAGSLTMLAFALGTLPVLALISFSSFSIRNSSKAGIFFKSAGLIVIAFAVLNLLSSLVAIGVIPPILNL